ncbi:hypothetical protein BC830DRAFT_1123492 [Chytriomyces sp. MP71]|nr:hypothetical protein BC830DRAFT_1123492 [Chytriomyces sp. MP71]
MDTTHNSRPLSSLPPEILDRIPGYLDFKQVMALAAAMCYFRPIAKAMYALRQHSPLTRWPKINLACRFPQDCRHQVGYLLRLAHRSGLAAHIHWDDPEAMSQDDLLSAIRLIPGNMPIVVRLGHLVRNVPASGVRKDPALDELISSRTRITRLELPVHPIWEPRIMDGYMHQFWGLLSKFAYVSIVYLDIWRRDVILKALCTVQGLKHVHINLSFCNITPYDTLKTMPDLETVTLLAKSSGYKLFSTSFLFYLSIICIAKDGTSWITNLCEFVRSLPPSSKLRQVTFGYTRKPPSRPSMSNDDFQSSKTAALGPGWNFTDLKGTEGMRLMRE